MINHNNKEIVVGNMLKILKYLKYIFVICIFKDINFLNMYFYVALIKLKFSYVFLKINKKCHH